MYFTDPFQYSVAGYRMAGMMVETQMRMMLVFADATFGGRNPFVSPPIARREQVEAPPKPASKTAKPTIARVVKSKPTPSDMACKRKGQTARVPVVSNSDAPAAPAG